MKIYIDGNRVLSKNTVTMGMEAYIDADAVAMLTRAVLQGDQVEATRLARIIDKKIYGDTEWNSEEQ